jgi:hypothetical protein
MLSTSLDLATLTLVVVGAVVGLHPSQRHVFVISVRYARMVATPLDIPTHGLTEQFTGGS